MAGAAASGVMLAALFPELGASFLAWVALVPLILVARASRPRAAAAHGLLAGILFHGVLLEWIRIFDTTGWLLLVVWQAIYVALFALLVRALSPSSKGWRAILAPAAAWTALEWVRALGRGGFTWGGLAYSQHGHLTLVQFVSVVGPFGLTFLIAAANAAVAALVGVLARPKGARDVGQVRRATVRLAATAAVLLAAWGWGRWRLAQPLPSGRVFRAAVLQGSVGGEGSRDEWDMDQLRKAVSIYLRLTEEAAQRGAALVVWPESAVPGYLLLDSGMRATLEQIAGAAARLRIDLIVGSAHEAPDGSRLNSAFLFTGEGRVAGRYDKMHLVPFGEYTPWRKQLAFLYRHFPVIPDDASSGQGFFPLHAPAAPVGVAICFESAFPGIARALRDSGAQVLAVLTNDGWFGKRSATWQHYNMAAFRAVETGSYVLRAATTGISAIVDPYGRTVAQSRLQAREALVAEVRALPRSTPYTRLGDLTAWASAVATAALLLSLLRRTRGV